MKNPFTTLKKIIDRTKSVPKIDLVKKEVNKPRGIKQTTMTKELKLKKQVPDSVNIAGIIPIRGEKAIGIIYICGNFVPVDGCELNTDELKQILTISENFFLFYNNLT